MDPVMLAVLFGGAMLAGWVDAVIGGGGLILIPLILAAFPQIAPAAALGTNKLAGVMGTASAAVTLVRKRGVDRSIFWRYVPLALVASGAGASAASMISKDVMRPVIIVLMLVVGIFVALKPAFGSPDAVAQSSRTRTLLGLVAVGAVGFYDGIFGPGTGMFLIMAFTAIFSQSFLDSAVMTKVVNVSTNLGALVVFALGGNIWFTLGLALAVANVIGAQIGARTVLGGGASFVRYAVLALVVIMACVLTYQQLHLT